MIADDDMVVSVTLLGNDFFPIYFYYFYKKELV